MEAFEKHVEFQELVYYQTQLRDDMVQWERINRDIDNMGKYYVSRRFDESTCCGTDSKFDFDAYAKEIECVERRRRATETHNPMQLKWVSACYVHHGRQKWDPNRTSSELRSTILAR